MISLLYAVYDKNSEDILTASKTYTFKESEYAEDFRFNVVNSFTNDDLIKIDEGGRLVYIPRKVLDHSILKFVIDKE